jgi:hypothetical protein
MYCAARRTAGGLAQHLETDSETPVPLPGGSGTGATRGDPAGYPAVTVASSSE